jgi:hypothetical protein
MGDRRYGLGVAWGGLAALVLIGCGGGDGNGAKGGEGGGETTMPADELETPEQDFTHVELDYRADAVVLEDVGAVQAALLRADYSAGELVFDSSFAGLDQLEVGSSALIGGVGVFHVLSRESQDEGELVRVEPAPLTDVLENAEISWRRSFVSSYAGAGIGLGVDEDETGNIQKLQQPLGSYKDGNLSFSGAIGPFATSFDLKPSAEGLDFKLSAKATSDFSTGGLTPAGANAIANAALSGSLHAFTHSLVISIEKSGLKRYDFEAHVAGDVAVEAGAVELGGDAKIKIPARLALPVLIGPIPFRLELGSSLEMASTLVANSSALMKGKSHFAAHAKASLVGKEVTYEGALDTSDLVLEKAENVATIESGASFVLNFPELTLGVGVPNALDASAQMKFATEIISNISFEYEAAGNYPVITGNCLESRTNFGAFYGGELSFLGFDVPVIEEKQLFGKLGTLSRSGKACKD